VTVDEETAVLAQLIRKVYEAEPLAYPKCWGSTRVIALIDSFRDFRRTRCIKPRGARSAGNAAVMCVCVHIAAGLERILRRSWQTTCGEETMKRTAIHRQKLPELPIAWRAAEYAALRANAADTCDDRVSENIFDVEDERAEVDIIVHRMNHGSN